MTERVGARSTAIAKRHSFGPRIATREWYGAFSPHNSMNSERHVNTVKHHETVHTEISVSCIARTRPTKTLCSLLSIDRHFPKLDVAGSIPVSRSNLFNNLRTVAKPVLRWCSVNNT